MTPSLGIVLVPTLPPEALRPLAAAADRHLDELWVWEDCFKESGVAAAAAALAWTDRVQVGIGLAPVPLRNVALLAMEVATVHRLFPGRFLPGIGHGVQDWMGQAGARERYPLTLLREHAQAMRLLLDGHEVSTSGRYVHPDRVKLDWPPEPGSPLLIGGGGPKTLELAGRYGDGILIGSAVSESELDASVAAGRLGWAQGRGADGTPMPVLAPVNQITLFMSASPAQPSAGSKAVRTTRRRYSRRTGRASRRFGARPTQRDRARRSPDGSLRSRRQ